MRIDGRMDSLPSPQPRVLCTHFPSDLLKAAVAGYKLVLAGHWHGSPQVFFTRRAGYYPGLLVHGWKGLRFTTGATTMFVSQGAADSSLLRFNRPREVLVCDLV